MRPTTRELGWRVSNILEALFDDASSGFARTPPGWVLCSTYGCSKVNEGMWTFTLATVERGNGVLVPQGHKLVDLRVDPTDRVAIGFLTNVKAVVEFGVPSIVTDAVQFYELGNIQGIARDIMFHLTGSFTPSV
jgi:hypothetical protein